MAASAPVPRSFAFDLLPEKYTLERLTRWLSYYSMRFARSHPLATVLIAAVLVRLVAVVWSQGFIHSDDHFDTISVAWDWLQGGLWGEDGNLRWKHMPAETIGRFPLYTLFLYAQMIFARWLGLESLEAMMYLIRGSHALISLLPVWVIFRVTGQVTRSTNWAVAAGLAIAVHFALPFLGVRNLIEMVGGSLWIVAILMFYRHRESGRISWLYLAGLFTGLAWMIRFQLAFAVLPIPFLLWGESGRLKPAVHYCLAVGLMLLASGLTDLFLLGRFAGSTITNLTMNTGLDALYNTIPLLYPVLLVLLMVPPISAVALAFLVRPGFIRSQRLLWFSSMIFLAAHWLHSNQQERFIFPILPAFLLMGILALWQYRRDTGRSLWDRRWFRITVVLAAVFNFAFLSFFTLAYGHKGMVEPMQWLRRHAPTSTVLILQPEVKRWSPVEYGGTDLRTIHVRGWDDPDWTRRGEVDRIDYVLVYPKPPPDPGVYLDSIDSFFGGVTLDTALTVRPSAYDRILHRLNPGHNDNFAAVLYSVKRDGSSRTGGP